MCSNITLCLPPPFVVILKLSEHLDSTALLSPLVLHVPVSCFVTQTQANRIFLWGESEINTYQKHRYDPWNNKERIRKKQLTIMSEDCSGFHFFRPNKAEPLTLRQCLNCWLRSRPALSLSLKLRLCLLHCKRLGRCQRGGWLATSWELAVLGLRPDRGLLRFQPPLC